MLPSCANRLRLKPKLLPGPGRFRRQPVLRRIHFPQRWTSGSTALKSSASRCPARARPVDVASVVIGGPYAVTGRGDTPSRARIFVCRPASPAARALREKDRVHACPPGLSRRPVSETDVGPLLGFYQERPARAKGHFDSGIQKASRNVDVPGVSVPCRAIPCGVALAAAFTESLKCRLQVLPLHLSSCGAAFPMTNCSTLQSKGNLRNIRPSPAGEPYASEDGRAQTLVTKLRRPTAAPLIAGDSEAIRRSSLHLTRACVVPFSKQETALSLRAFCARL